MRKTLEVFRFELEHQTRRVSTLLYFVAGLFLCAFFLRMMAAGSALDGTHFNSPFAVMVTGVMGSMLAMLVVAGFAGDAAVRDLETRIDSLYYSSPVGKRAYILGRFSGAFAVSALVLLALPAGAIFATWMPWVEPGSLGPFRAWAYLAPFLIFVLPNAFVATAMFFALALLTRRAIASYAGAAFLFIFAMVCGKLLVHRIGWDEARLLDPLGYTPVLALWQSLNAVQKNTFVLALDGPLLANRLLWLGIALTLLTAAYVRFRFGHEVVGRESTMLKSKAADEARAEATHVAAPVARRVFDARTRMRQLLAITVRSFRELHASRAWWIVPVLALIFIMVAPDLAKTEMGVPGALVTGRIVEYFAYDDTMIWITLLIALSAGELVWRERGARIYALAGVTPSPDWVSVTGKFLAIALMLVATVTIFMIAGLVVQTIVGVPRYDLALYVQVLFGFQLPAYLLTAALAMVVHVIVNQKYVANVLVAVVPVITDLLQGLGVQHNLLLYGNVPSWVHSDLAGFGPGIESRLWFTFYFGGWALLFALGTYLFWVRGDEDNVRQRLALARRRLTRPAAALGATAVAIIAGVGGYIFYNTNILNDFRTGEEIEQRAAEFERRYGRYASLPQPILSAKKLHVEFHPRGSAATIRGTYTLENRSSEIVDSIHLVTDPGAETSSVSFDRPSRPTLTDDDLGYRIYALDRGLKPGESLKMSFRVAFEARGFTNSGGNPAVMPDWSSLEHRPGKNTHSLPLVGYRPTRELNNAVLRAKYGLSERPPYPQLDNVALRNEQKAHEIIDLEVIVGTEAGQIGVAPGELRRTWAESGRRYAHYRTDAPISNAWMIVSSDYAVHRARWRDVDIEIFHHPAHTANLERMAQSVRASLEYNTKEFGPYPYRQVRLVEFPSGAQWLQMTAHGGFILYAEGFSFVRPEADPRDIDFPFAVVAHEMGHQWWGQQVRPAPVEGAPFLSESLAWYNGMLVVEETFGRDHMKRLLQMMRAQYLAPQQTRTVPLLRMVGQMDAYRMGPFAMYAVREAVGVERVNAAL